MINKPIPQEKEPASAYIKRIVPKTKTRSLRVAVRTNKELYSVKDKETGLPLRKLTALYNYITQITNDCLWEWDLSGKKILWIDGGHKRVLGYPIENDYITLAFWKSCIHPADRIRVISKLNKTLASPESTTWEDKYRFKKKNGGFAYVHDRALLVYDLPNTAPRMIGATQDVTGMVLLQNKLEAERNTRLKEMTGAILTAQEKERAEIGRELHDNLGQVLAVSKMYLQLALRSEYKWKEYVGKTLQYVADVMIELRRIAKTLVIPPTHIIGLLDNIRNLVSDISFVHPVKIIFSARSIHEDSISEKLQVTIFRIVQEQLNNILKHSGATEAAITLNVKDNNIVLLISDNGVGCNSNTKSNGVGLINIKSRAEINHGSVTIKSKTGKGYWLKVKLPLLITVEDNNTE